jgi:hypothetical protein
MSTTETHAETFTAAERYFTTLPTVAEGLMLRTWKTGGRCQRQCASLGWQG